MNETATSKVLGLLDPAIAQNATNAAISFRIGAFGHAVEDFARAGGDARTPGRVAETYDRLCSAIHVAIAQAEARGRATALAEVDTACAHLFADPKGPGWNLELIGPWPDDPPGTPWRLRTCPIDDYTAAPTPTAAILAAAAAVHDETAR